MQWVAFMVAGLGVLVMCYVPSNDWLDTRYAYLTVAMIFLIVAAVTAPLPWKIIIAVTAAVVIYLAERHYARLWDRPRLWWYRFFQDSK